MYIKLSNSKILRFPKTLFWYCHFRSLLLLIFINGNLEYFAKTISYTYFECIIFIFDLFCNIPAWNFQILLYPSLVFSPPLNDLQTLMHFMLRVPTSERINFTVSRKDTRELFELLSFPLYFPRVYFLRTWFRYKARKWLAGTF